jgi:hypothetical protein
VFWYTVLMTREDVTLEQENAPKAPPDGVCQVAVDELVAVGTCPDEGVPLTATPEIFVALIVPVPLTSSDPPVPITRALAFVPEVIAEKAAPPPETPQAPPASSTSHVAP